MAGPPVAVVTVSENPDDPTHRTIRFVVTGASSAITWRFGDCTDHPDAAPVTMDHTYGADGSYAAIAVVGETGQQLVVPVEVPYPGG
jgi:hypothetical protein